MEFLRRLKRRTHLEREMRDELAFHLQARTDDLIRAGVPLGEAQRRARIEFGGIEMRKEELRDVRRIGFLEDLARDIDYAWRSLRKSPAFTMSAVCAIALGVGVNTALFSLVYGVLFRPLPVRDPGTIRNVYIKTRGDGGRSSYGSQYFVSFPEFTYLRSGSQTAELAAVAEANMSSKFSPADVHAQLVSDNMLPMIGAAPALGRFFTPQEVAKPGSEPVVVLSYETWRRYFGGEDVVGRSIVLNRTHFTIIGVTNEHSSGPLVLKPDLWIPLTMQGLTRAGESLIDNPNAGWIQIIGRKKQGVTDASMLAELQLLGQQSLLPHAPKRKAIVTIAAGAFLNYPDVMSQSVPVLGILFLAFSLVLVVACANVANMLVARGFSRGRELAIRLSMGAGKRRLVRQLLTEHLLLGLVGGVIGLGISQIAVRSLMAVVPQIGANQLDVSPDWRIVTWTVMIALGAGLLFGLPAALGMVRGDLSQSLRADGFGAGSKAHRFKLQNALIVMQVAVSAVLLINSGLLLRAFGNATHLDVGQAVNGVLIASPNLRALQYTPEQAERFMRDFSESASALPGVSGVAVTGFDPLLAACGDMPRLVSRDGSSGAQVTVSCNETGQGFLRVMRIPLLQGRDFDPVDSRSEHRVVIIDQGFAHTYFQGNPIGQKIRFGNSPEDDHEVIGIVASTKPVSFLSPNRPQVYRPLKGLRNLEAKLVLGYDGSSPPSMTALQILVARMDRDVSVQVKPIEQNVTTALSVIRIAAGGVSTLGFLALLLASSGVYGVVAFTVGRKHREIGIRRALGATSASVAGLLVWEGMRPVLIGSAIGVLLAGLASRLIRSMLYGISPTDALGFGGAIAVLAGIALLAAILPAGVALRLDPSETLRHE